MERLKNENTKGDYMKVPVRPDYSQTPCKSVVADNIKAIKNGESLNAPLSYLNKSCEFRKVYNVVFGPLTADREKKNAKLRTYLQSPEAKARMCANQRKYRNKPEVKERRAKIAKRYRDKPRVRKRRNLRMRKRYKSDSKYREKILKKNRGYSKGRVRK